ncbi:NAD(P)-binding protein, partial [Aureobasidium melanogenum]
MVVLYYLPTYFQVVRGSTAAQSGYYQIPAIAGDIIGVGLQSTGVTLIGYYTPFMWAATILMPVLAGLLTTIKTRTSLVEVLVMTGCFGFAGGIGFLSPQSAVQMALPKNDASIGLSIILFAEQFGAALFVSAAQNVFQNSIGTAGLSDLRDLVAPADMMNVLVAVDQSVAQTCFFKPDTRCQSQSTVVSTMSLQSTGRDRLPSTMIGVVLTGHGGFEKLQYRKDLKIPSPGPDEVLIRVAAAGINNTDINTRIGWYSKGVETGTGEETTNASATRTDDDSTWSGKPLVFPRIQGADCCGRIVAVGNNVSTQRVGERVLVRNMLRSYVDYRPYECWTFGSECDGAFAQFTKAPARETYKIDCDLSDTDLASVPCAWSTAENMLHRAGVKDKENVIITGASGGVGAAAIQLAKRRGAHVVAIGSAEKADQMLALGADQVLPRGANLVKQLGNDVVDVVLDLVAGSVFPELLDVLKKGGRYAVAGAIAGPIVRLDVRTLYLKDLSFFGCTFQEDEVFTNLISYIERGEIRPRAGKVYPLDEIVAAQQHFNSKSTCGKLALSIP